MKMSMMKGNTTISSLSTKSQSGSVATKLRIDLIVEVDDALLHIPKLKLIERVIVSFWKFPLPSRSGRLNRVVFEFRNSENDHIKLAGFPGGADSFELAAKFCCGSAPIQITTFNVAALRCAAEYLEMTEDLEEGNLISKTEAFLTYILRSSWLDCITVLRSCSGLSPWADNLNIEQRCVDCIAWRAVTEPARIKWPFTPINKTHHYMLPSDKRIRIQSSCGEESSHDAVYQSERPRQLPDIGLEIQKLRAEFTTLKDLCQHIFKQLEKVSTHKISISPACALPWNFLPRNKNLGGSRRHIE